MWCTPTREQVTQAYFEIRTIGIGVGWKITHLSILKGVFCLFVCFFGFVLLFLFFVFVFVCLFVCFCLFFHTLIIICFLSPPCNFWLIFSNLIQLIQYYRNGKFKRLIFQNHTSRETTCGLIHKWLYLNKYKEYELDFWYQITAESVLLTKVPKTNFPQNVICSLFLGSASHVQIFCNELISECWMVL